MRATILAVLGVAIAAGVSGCDQVAIPGSQPAQQQAAVAPPPPAPVAAPACNCQQDGEHLKRFASATHHYRHRYGYGGGYHGSYTSQSENSVDAYGYVSRSSVSYSVSRSSSDAYEGDAHGYDMRGHHYYRGGVVWVDGYGRGYFNNGPVTVAQTMNGKRMHPYHGYDADCPDHRGGPDGY